MRERKSEARFRGLDVGLGMGNIDDVGLGMGNIGNVGLGMGKYR